jgi:hypothetical protein
MTEAFLVRRLKYGDFILQTVSPERRLCSSDFQVMNPCRKTAPVSVRNGISQLKSQGRMQVNKSRELQGWGGRIEITVFVRVQ